MPLVAKPQYIHEPTPLQCGQAVLAMLGGKTVDEIIALVGTERETTLKDMKQAMCALEIEFSNQKKEAHKKADLPSVCILSLETPRCWHWSLYFDGVFYDPEHGVMDDFCESNRRYYWEIYKNC
ncbi:MAG: hypothetical protein J6I80_01475 [Clostridia bacterium]|nr:hypothetical protein [Clostridia bacterium]